jgi:lipopolysaccharide biosynthesis glycosyltransferase
MVEPLAVVCAVSGRFAVPLAVMMRSLLVHLNPGRRVTFYVFESDLPPRDHERLESVASDEGASVVWLRADRSLLTGLPAADSLSIYDRLLAGDAMPASLSKVLWLDADLLVMRDVGELWTLDMDGAAALAVQDLAIPYVSSPLGLREWRALGLRADAPHFNSGVLVVDLETWRREEIGAKALHYLRSQRHSIAYYDQEALNAVLAGRWRAIDPRWNLIASLAGRRCHPSSHLPEEVYRRAVQDPWIFHFAGDWKPWTLPHGGYPYDLYFSYLDQTPWSGWRPRASLGGSFRGFYHKHLRERLYPLEVLCMALRFRRLPQYLGSHQPSD